jgi:ferrous iron transport protein A
MSNGSTGTGEGGHAGKKISLAEMRAGESGKIVQIDGGYALSRKLDALGIRVGKEITKVSGHWMRGPVLLQQNTTQAAIGFGMAGRVFVELSRKGDE